MLISREFILPIDSEYLYTVNEVLSDAIEGCKDVELTEKLYQLYVELQDQIFIFSNILSMPNYTGKWTPLLSQWIPKTSFIFLKIQATIILDVETTANLNETILDYVKLIEHVLEEEL